jgi:hypothetical protein
MLISDGVEEAWARTFTSVLAGVLWRCRKMGAMICVASSRFPPAGAD